MDRLQAFEAMLSDIQAQCEQEKKAMDELKAKGKEKTATYKPRERPWKNSPALTQSLESRT